MRIIMLILTILFSVQSVTYAESMAFVWRKDVTKIPTMTSENIQVIQDYFTESLDRKFTIETPQEEFAEELEDNPSMTDAEFAARHGYDYVVSFAHMKGWIEHLNHYSRQNGATPIADISLSITYMISTPDGLLTVNASCPEKRNTAKDPEYVVKWLFKENMEYLSVFLRRIIFHDSFPQPIIHTEDL